MKLRILRGNILDFKGNVIVNTANSHLSPGKGLDGKIRLTGGHQIGAALDSYIRRYGYPKVSDVVATTAGRLRYDFVLHAIGPLWKGGGHDEDNQLRQTYLNCLKEADRRVVKSIAIPNISTGIFKFPKDIAAQIAIGTIRGFKSDYLDEVYIYCFDEENYKIHKKLTNQ